MIQTINPNFRVFRDDLYPFLLGGNKGRKMMSIVNLIREKKYNAIVTTGGISSNHCRSVSIICKQNNWNCTLVLHGNKKKFYSLNGNSLIIRSMNPKIVFCNDYEISEKMDFSMEKYKQDGFRPYYLWGGGHTLEGGLAYIDALEELNIYCIENRWFPDYIFLASGTGSTQAGIISGLDKFRLHSQVIGISIARKSESAIKIINEFYINLNNYYKIDFMDREIIVLDDYLFGGYEKFNNKLKSISDSAIKDYGFILDTTYSGKAFFGMHHFIKKNNLAEKNILFWHTGGNLNYLS